MTPTPLQTKIMNIRDSIRRIQQQQSNLTAFIDCLAINLEALSEQVGYLENNSTPRKDK